MVEQGLELPGREMGRASVRQREGRGRARWSRLGFVLAAALLMLGLALLWSRYQEGRLGDQARRAVGRALEFLARSQLPTGELPTYAWRDGEPAGAQYVRTPFTASQVLHSLAFVEDGGLGRDIRQRTIDFLLAHREPPGLWRYYGKDDGYYAEVYARFRHPKLPPDVDDTAQSWAALSEHGHPVDPQALEALEANRTGAGLFNTWIASPDEVGWMDSREREVDLVVNLNALFVFARAGRTLPEVCTHVTAATTRKAFYGGTIWYPTPLAYAYFLSRAYADGGATCLTEAASEVRSYVVAQQRADGGWDDDLGTALAVITLLNTGPGGAEVRRGVRALVRRQGPDGGWETSPLYRGAVLHYGSRALTTAFSVEALGKYLDRE